MPQAGDGLRSEAFILIFSRLGNENLVMLKRTLKVEYRKVDRKGLILSKVCKYGEFRMADGIIQRVFDRKSKYIADWYTAFAIEQLKHELVIEMKKELESYPFGKSDEISSFKQWLIGDN